MVRKKRKVGKGRKVGKVGKEKRRGRDLIEHDPVSSLEGAQQGAISPGKLSPLAPLHGQVSPKQIRHILGTANE